MVLLAVRRPLERESVMSEFSRLLSPLPIGRPGHAIEIRNRVLVSAHVPGFAEHNQPGNTYIAYHQRFAAQGVGLQLTGGTPVHKSGLLSTAGDGLWNLDDSIIPGYQRLADAVHGEGGRILAQLAHSGGTVLIDQPGTVAWSASSVRSAITGRVAHAMTVDEIAEVIAAHEAAAARVRQGGLDGVEVLAAFGYLPQAFLSPLSNHRRDEYGGSLENRVRFLVELLRAVRAQLADGQILGYRLPGDEFEPGGLDLQQMIDVCRLLAERGLVDYLNIIAHTNFTHTGRSKHWAPTPTPHGVFVDLAAAIKAEVSVPVFTVGRVVDPVHAERIIAQGKADMVGMTRAHICDPTIVSKIKLGQLQQIRPCVGANTCIANRYAGKPIRCMHNPELKAPGQVLLPTKKPRRIAVIGGGPAGLEVARLSATRGHSVVVFEASASLGGQLAYWSRSPSMAELGRIIRWRESELRRLGVEVEFNRAIASTDLGAIDAQLVVVATGACETMRHHDLPLPVTTPMQLLDRSSIDARRAIVISDGRGQAGLVAAEWLLDRGAEVEVVSEDFAVAGDLDATNRNAWYERLGKRGVIFTAQSSFAGFRDGAVQLRNVFSGALTERPAIELLVDWNGCQSQDALMRAASPERLAPLQAIGDCLAPRNVETAMAEALRLAEQL